MATLSSIGNSDRSHNNGFNVHLQNPPRKKDLKRKAPPEREIDSIAVLRRDCQHIFDTYVLSKRHFARKYSIPHVVLNRFLSGNTLTEKNCIKFRDAVDAYPTITQVTKTSTLKPLKNTEQYFEHSLNYRMLSKLQSILNKLSSSDLTNFAQAIGSTITTLKPFSDPSHVIRPSNLGNRFLFFHKINAFAKTHLSQLYETEVEPLREMPTTKLTVTPLPTDETSPNDTSSFFAQVDSLREAILKPRLAESEF